MILNFKKNIFLKQQRGTILILALWTLTFLSVLAVSIGGGIRQKFILLERLEERQKLRLTTEAGIKKAIALLIASQNSATAHLFSIAEKSLSGDNARQFSNIALNDSVCEVSVPIFAPQGKKQGQRFGIEDEEGKLNLNKADVNTLNALIQNVTGLSELQSGKLATAIYDWRISKEEDSEGFFKDVYYDNLQYPYVQKHGNFETLDELLLVKGMSQNIFDQLVHYATIYGNGKVNINTASKPALMVLGLSEGAADKLLQCRQGTDGAEGTEDDYIFLHASDIIVDLQNEKLNGNEVAEFNELNSTGKITTMSSNYSIRAVGHLLKKDVSKTISCIYNTSEHKIKYWKES